MLIGYSCAAYKLCVPRWHPSSALILYIRLYKVISVCGCLLGDTVGRYGFSPLSSGVSGDDLVMTGARAAPGGTSLSAEPRKAKGTLGPCV